MSRLSSATIDYTLTNYAQGHMNDLAGGRAIVDALCPVVNVPGATGQYKTFNDINSFQVYATARGLGGPARRLEFGASDGTFNCKPQALEITIDDGERDQVGESSLAGQMLEQGKVRTLLSGASLSHVKKVVDFVAANTTAVSDRGNWSNANIDPIAQINEQIVALATAMGSTAYIKFTLGITAFQKLIDHPKVASRRSGIKVGGITGEDIKAMLIFPVDITVGVLSYNTVKPGQTVSKSQVLGDVAYLTFTVPNPTVYDPSPFKCFTTGVNNIASVRRYRAESNRSDVLAVDWSEDIVATSAISVKRFDIT